MNVVFVPVCQEPCCRVKRGESARPETPEEVGRRIAGKALGIIATRMDDPVELDYSFLDDPA